MSNMAPAAPRPEPKPTPVEDELTRRAQALARLRAADLRRAHEAREMGQAVRDARAAGATWLEVGRVLDVSPQAAHKRFSGAR